MTLDCQKELRNHPIFNQSYLAQFLILIQKDSINDKDIYWMKRVMFTVLEYYYGRYQVVIHHFIQKNHMILAWLWKFHKVLEKKLFLIPLMIMLNFILVNIFNINLFLYYKNIFHLFIIGFIIMLFFRLLGW